jgi:hypothetical protein
MEQSRRLIEVIKYSVGLPNSNPSLTNYSIIPLRRISSNGSINVEASSPNLSRNHNDNNRIIRFNKLNLILVSTSALLILLALFSSSSGTTNTKSSPRSSYYLNYDEESYNLNYVSNYSPATITNPDRTNKYLVRDWSLRLGRLLSARSDDP